MQWQRLLRSAAAVVGAAAVGCDSAPSLRAADPPAAVAQPAAARLQKPDAGGKTVTQTSLSTTTDTLHGGRLVASARAIVNGAPILDDEITEAALGPLATINPASPTYDSDVKKIKAAALEQLIERELLIKEATTKLTKAGKKDVLEKVYEEADGQFERWVKQARSGFPSDEAFKKYLLEKGTSFEGQKRLRRRIFLADQYLHSNVMRYVDRGTGHREVYDYYLAHPEEFQRTDNVQWQDIFIDAGDQKKYATRADAQRKAQELQTQAKSGGTEDFVHLCHQYDDGLAKTKKGAAGIGTRREDISPPEAATVLFQLSDGQVGPIVGVPAGFHVLRVVKRTHAGLAPFDDEVQKQIKDKLRNEIYARESKRYLEELKRNAHIERMP
jgi:parvulin-like peptidyl-prolyl isomerase